MTSLLVVFLLVVLLPLFISTWRTSLAGLGTQGLLMGFMIYVLSPTPTWERTISLIDVVAVRGLIVPFLLYRVLHAGHAPRRNDVIPPNLLSWGLVGILVALAFHFATRVVPSDAQLHMHLAVASTAILLGLFVLATQTGAFSQVVGALRIENAVALFELASDQPVAPLPVQVGQLVVFILTAVLYAFYVNRLSPTTEPTRAEPPAEGPAL
jgi:hydrogenase-4 membrane subunit HyfE